MNDDIQNGVHVGALLSGYIDGELTQQDRQRVEVHCDTCSQCQTTLEELKDLRRQVGKTRLSELGEDKWREDMNDTTVNVSRGIGWLLIIGCALVVGGDVAARIPERYVDEHGREIFDRADLRRPCGFVHFSAATATDRTKIRQIQRCGDLNDDCSNQREHSEQENRENHRNGSREYRSCAACWQGHYGWLAQHRRWRSP